MAKDVNSIFMWQCGVEHCKETRVSGTGYCAKHASLQSRASAHGERTWLWIPATAIPAWWCLNNASQLLGVSCKRISFTWRTIATSAFRCENGDFAPSTGYSWLSAPSGTALGTALSIVGFMLGMSAVAVSIVLWNRAKRRH